MNNEATFRAHKKRETIQKRDEMLQGQLKLVDNLSDLRTDESTRRRVMWPGNKMSLVCARTRTTEQGDEQRRFCAQNTGLNPALQEPARL